MTARIMVCCFVFCVGVKTAKNCQHTAKQSKTHDFKIVPQATWWRGGGRAAIKCAKSPCGFLSVHLHFCLALLAFNMFDPNWKRSGNYVITLAVTPYVPKTFALGCTWMFVLVCLIADNHIPELSMTSRVTKRSCFVFRARKTMRKPRVWSSMRCLGNFGQFVFWSLCFGCPISS